MRPPTALRARYENGLVCSHLAVNVFDLSLPAAAPIIAKLHAGAALIKWALENSVTHMETLGWSVSAQGTLLAAKVFGREEDGFAFSQSNIDEVIRVSKFLLRPLAQVCRSIH